MEHWPASTQAVDASELPLDEPASVEPLDEPASVEPLDEPLEVDIPDELDAPEDPARPEEDPDEPARPEDDPEEPDDDPEEAPDEVESMLASGGVIVVSPDPPQATTIAKPAPIDARIKCKAVDMFKPSAIQVTRPVVSPSGRIFIVASGSRKRPTRTQSADGG